MNRDGTVVAVLDDNRVVVQLSKHTACGDCGACHLGDENKNIKIICNNTHNAKEGERVVVDLDFSDVLSAAFIMYTVPLIALLLGVFGGYFAYQHFISPSGSEVFAMFTGFVTMALAYLFIKTREGKFEKNEKYMTRIVQVYRTQILMGTDMAVAPQRVEPKHSNFGHQKLSL